MGSRKRSKPVDPNANRWIGVAEGACYGTVIASDHDAAVAEFRRTRLVPDSAAWSVRPWRDENGFVQAIADEFDQSYLPW